VSIEAKYFTSRAAFGLPYNSDRDMLRTRVELGRIVTGLNLINCRVSYTERKRVSANKGGTMMMLDSQPKPCSSHQDTAGAEAVIFVHGTAAGDVSDSGSRWWQFGSLFERKLRELLPSSISIKCPFHWSGANWEEDRRLAGAKLLARLRQLDDSNTGYHLIGHSHGGSVILAALRLTCGRGQKPLVGLRSWTTVGTPFFSTQPEPINIPFVTAAVVVAICIAVVIHQILPYLIVDSGAWRSHANWLLSAIPAIMLLIYGLVVISNASVPLIKTFAFKSIKLRNLISERRYSEHWLGLWHPDDEAINGLSSSIGEPITVIPRFRFSYSIYKIFLLPLLIYNWWIATALDQFLWNRIARKVQGNDQEGVRLCSVQRSPFARRRWPELLAQISDRMSTLSDREAAVTLSGVRKLLGTAYVSQDPNGVVTQLKTKINWGAIIHTSYFDDPNVASLIALHIIKHSRSYSSPLSEGYFPNELKSWLDSSAKNELSAGPKTFASRQGYALPALVSSLIIVIGLLLSITTLSAFRTFIMPHTDRAQVDRIVNAVHDGELLNVHAKLDAGKVLHGLYLAGRGADWPTLLQFIREPAAFGGAVRELSSAFGRKGDIEAEKKLLKLLKQRNTDTDIVEALTGFLRTSAKSGNPAIIEPFLSDFEAAVGTGATTQQRNVALSELSIAFGRLGERERARVYADRIILKQKEDVQCVTDNQPLIGAFLLSGLDDRIEQLYAICNSSNYGRARGWLDAASAALIDGITDIANKALQTASTFNYEQTKERVQLIESMFALGRSNEAQTQVKAIIDELSGGNEEQQQRLGGQEALLFNLAHSLYDRGLKSEGDMLVQATTNYLLIRAQISAAPGVIIRDLYLAPFALLEFDHVQRARQIANLLKDVAFNHVEIKPNSEAAQLLIYVAKALKDVGFYTDYETAVKMAKIAIPTAVSTLRHKLWIKLSELLEESQAYQAISNATDAISDYDEFYTRSNNYVDVAQRWTSLSEFENALIVSDRAAVPEDRLRGYFMILSKLMLSSDVGDDEERHDWFSRFDTDQMRRQAQKQLTADARRPFQNEADTLPPSKELARKVCEVASSSE
jgi:hypothetical protein